jgi:hypothetical protein
VAFVWCSTFKATGDEANNCQRRSCRILGRELGRCQRYSFGDNLPKTRSGEKLCAACCGALRSGSHHADTSTINPAILEQLAENL